MKNENMRVKKTKAKQVLKIGDIMYVQGYRSSQVEVIGHPDDDNVEIRYITAPAYKPESEGEERFMSRQCLYPNGGR